MFFYETKDMFKNLIKKKISTEKGIQILLVVLGIFLILIDSRCFLFLKKQVKSVFISRLNIEQFENKEKVGEFVNKLTDLVYSFSTS